MQKSLGSTHLYKLFSEIMENVGKVLFRNCVAEITTQSDSFPQAQVLYRHSSKFQNWKVRSWDGQDHRMTITNPDGHAAARLFQAMHPIQSLFLRFAFFLWEV